MNDIMSWWRGRPPLRFATRTFTPVGLATNWPASGDNGLAASFQLRWNLYLYQPVFCPTVGVHFTMTIFTFSNIDFIQPWAVVDVDPSKLESDEHEYYDNDDGYDPRIDYDPHVD